VPSLSPPPLPLPSTRRAAAATAAELDEALAAEPADYIDIAQLQNLGVNAADISKLKTR
jgi:hypothetical protein